TPPTRVPSQALSPASGSVHYSFALLPHFGPTSRSSTMWISCAGTVPRLPLPRSRLDWTRRAPKRGGQCHAVPRSHRFSDPQRGDNRSCRATLRTTSKSDLRFQEVSIMTSPSIRKHAGTGAASDQPAVPEPSFAERARTLVYMARIGSLSTLSRKQPGFPFGSVMPYALDDRGCPIFLISTMAMHTQNLQADP